MAANFKNAVLRPCPHPACIPAQPRISNIRAQNGSHDDEMPLGLLPAHFLIGTLWCQARKTEYVMVRAGQFQGCRRPGSRLLGQI